VVAVLTLPDGTSGTSEQDLHRLRRLAQAINQQVQWHLLGLLARLEDEDGAGQLVISVGRGAVALHRQIHGDGLAAGGAV